MAATRGRILFSVTLVAMVLVSALTCPSRADVLVSTDGRQLVGEVEEETRRFVKFRCQIHGIWTTITVDRRDIYALTREDGDQSDRAAPEEPEAEKAPPGTEPAERSDRPVVVVVPLHGQVGGSVDDGLSGTFDSGALIRCFELARAQGADLVVLDIRSPGGFVSEMEAICETIIDWHDRLRVVAFPQEAYSAAAIISLSCKELVVRPDSQLGAAVIIKGGGRADPTAVEAKFASPHHAKQRQYMRASGQPYAVVAAMTIQEKELWWSPLHGFRASEPEDAERGSWEQLDGATTVLTATGEEMLRWRVADASAEDLMALLLELGVAADARIVKMDGEIEAYNDALGRRFARLRQNFKLYFEGLQSIAQGLAALSRLDQKARKSSPDRAEVNRGRRKLISAAKRIEKADTELLARSAEVPQQILDRLEEDRQLLKDITDLLRGGSDKGFNEAVDRVNEVMAAWKKIFSS